MEASLLEHIKEQLVRHEGLRLKPYRCTAGKLTIGIQMSVLTGSRRIGKQNDNTRKR